MPPLRFFLATSAVLLGSALTGGATGYYGPSEFLAEGAKGLVNAPEFYWELEVKRLAAELNPGDKPGPSPARTAGKEEAELSEKLRLLGASTEGADEKDFAAALAAGRLKPADPAAARAQHQAARKYLDALDPQVAATAPPEEFASEFADYHRGAAAFRRGREHWDEARAAWEKLLARPEAERHYRTVWATFMLGKIAMKRDQPEGAGLFRRVRELVKSGFSDSLGMAAESHGWEARCEWRTGHPEKAAPIYLRQLAQGDLSAIVSLKALVPDREVVEGMASYQLAGEPSPGTPEGARVTVKKLRAAAADPLLRRLVTVHILATATSESGTQEGAPRAASRGARWLKILQEARIAAVEDAEYLGWIAYNEGNYPAAAQWLGMARAEAPAACWLRAKLQRRAGQLEAAVTSMALALRSLRTAADYTRWQPPPEAAGGRPDDPFPDPPEGLNFGQAAGGMLGALRLERTDFLGALTAFLQAHLWTDAAFVAERVLYLDELKKFVDAQPAPSAEEKDDRGSSLRYLLGRRLVREDRYAEAAAYLPAPYPEVLAKYVQALQAGANENLTKTQRARAWFSAAWTARVDGMELMGTEVAPDGFTSDGAFPNADVGAERLSGILKPNDGGTEPPPKPVAITARPAAPEKERLRKNRVSPEVRFHYRVIAAALAMRAAALLPDNSEELADVINRAGWWVRDRDQKLADRYFQELKRRAGSTALGRAALQKRWFVDERGPWSAEEEAVKRPGRKE